MIVERIFSNPLRIASEKIPNILKPSVTLSEKELIAKYFNRYYIYLEPFFNQKNGFYTILEMHNRLICVMGESNCRAIDNNLTKHSLVNMIRHQVIKSGTDYKKALSAIYEDLNSIGIRKGRRRKVSMNIGIISFHKNSGFLEFVGNGISMNYYRKNTSVPILYNHANNQTTANSLIQERIETYKGDRFFIKKYPSEERRISKQRASWFSEYFLPNLRKSISKIAAVTRNTTTEKANTNASMMLAFTL